MEKEESQKSNSDNLEENKDNKDLNETSKKKDLKPEDQIKELEDKLARAYAEIENQRRRFEKEKNVIKIFTINSSVISEFKK